MALIYSFVTYLNRPAVHIETLCTITIYIDLCRTTSYADFHNVFKQAFGFPDFYGANMDAWIDCMSQLDDSESGMSQLSIKPNQLVVLEMIGITELAYHCPTIYKDLIECTLFLNQRRVLAGHNPILALLFR